MFTIAEAWKQPKCPLTDEWIKKMWSVCIHTHTHTHTHVHTHYTHTYILDNYSAIKMNKIMTSSNMDGSGDYSMK